MDERLKEFDREWREGDRERARQMAREYVDAHRAGLEATLRKYTLEDLVALVDAYRRAGQEADRIIADMWLLAEYEPQRINGELSIGGEQAVAMAEAALREER